MEKLQTHSSVTLGTQHGPTSWSALWAFPQTGRDTGGKPTLVPILIELPDMAEEEIDVQEACDAGLVDREDLVDELSKQVGYVCVCFIALPEMLLFELFCEQDCVAFEHLAV